MINLIIISLIILNVFSILVVFNMLKGLDIKYRLAVTACILVAVFLLANIIFSIGQNGVAKELSSASRPLLLFSIYPINLIVMASPIAVQINKLKSADIEKDKFIRNIVICLIVDIILIIIECNYIKSVITGISKMVEIHK